MTAGPLNQRVSIQSPTFTRNAMGEPVPTWITLGHRWAAIEPASGARVTNGEQLQSETTHVVRLRYWSSITPRCRILFGSRVLEINGIVAPAERGDEMVLACAETT
jgi:SPP1 family predicted phage head-tail adaptor